MVPPLAVTLYTGSPKNHKTWELLTDILEKIKGPSFKTGSEKLV